MSWGVSVSGESQNLSRQQATADVICHPSCQPSPLTLLRSSPPLGRSGVLCSEDGFVFSLLLLESLSLMMSYCLQKRAITAAGRQGMKDSLTLAAPCLPSPQHPSWRAVLVTHTLHLCQPGPPQAPLHVWSGQSPWADETWMQLKPAGHTRCSVPMAQGCETKGRC